MFKKKLKPLIISLISVTFLNGCELADTIASLSPDERKLAGEGLRFIGDELGDFFRNDLIGRASSGSDSGSAPPPPPPPPVSFVATISSQVASRHTVGTYDNKGTPDNFNDDVHNYTITQTRDTFSLRARGDRAIVMTVNGVPHMLNQVAYGFSSVFEGKDEASLTFNVYLTDIGEVINGTNESIQGAYVFYDTGKNNLSGANVFNLNFERGYATVGIETPAFVVANQSAQATYEGDAKFDIHPSQITNANLDTNRRYSSRKLSMNVDFNADTVQGTVILRGYNETTDIGTLTLASAPIVGNRFTGSFTLDQAMLVDAGLTDNPTGTYSGNFFGTDADDIAGVLQLNGTNADGAVIGIGGFSADRQ